LAVNFFFKTDCLSKSLWKPASQIAHLVFAESQANAKKPKELTIPHRHSNLMMNLILISEMLKIVLYISGLN